MRTIWKFKLEPGETIIPLPKSDKLQHFLHAGIDHKNNSLALWVRIYQLDESDPMKEVIGDEPMNVRVRVKGTGHDCKDVTCWAYLGTVHQDIVTPAHVSTQGGSLGDAHRECLVWHVFVEPSNAYLVGPGD
jgi:hypothetical protein